MNFLSQLAMHKESPGKLLLLLKRGRESNTTKGRDKCPHLKQGIER
jgi:hypothetical protein